MTTTSNFPVPASSTLPRVEKLNEIVAHINASPRATTSQAQVIVDRLLGMYPTQQPRNPEVYIPMLVIACEGVDIDILKAMVHPRLGLRSKWLPSVEEVVDYLDSKMQARQRELERAQSELEALTRLPAPEESEQAKAAALARWEATRKHLKPQALDEGEGR